MSGNTIISVDDLNCLYAADDDVLRQYVTGKLPNDDAEEFEEHLFACERCREEVETAIELRAALAREQEIRRESPASVSRYAILALAAAAAIAVVGLWRMQDRGPLQPAPLRSSVSREIAASGRLVAGTLTLSWRAVDAASSYRVQVLNAVGEPVNSTETAATNFSVALPPTPPGEALYWKVQALDDDHVVIASSQLRKIEP